MITICRASQLHLLEFVERKAPRREVAALAKRCKGDLGVGKTPSSMQTQGELNALFNDTSANFKTPLVFGGTPFYRQVWEALHDISSGTTQSYSEFAKTIDRPTAMRALARANGSLTRYGGGLWRKQRPLEIDRLYRPPKPAKISCYLG
ncbi:MAG: methylated-DNA--[protein]-cysteine S-methyltransferase [Cellvibrionales bacterium]|nr:methylated-DNA--[protein]-cysteine S-methyltransferase [Porticoccaceae bacterium]|tara:strand:+ start:50971 stop:51417 length:447 start_codon:yes stop_codon:yes gene_type:complete